MKQSLRFLIALSLLFGTVTLTGCDDEGCTGSNCPSPPSPSPGPAPSPTPGGR